MATMKYDPLKHHRHSIRLRGYDYSQGGAYFVTICVDNRECLFDDRVLRRVAETYWRTLPQHFPNVVLDEWIVMPNHLHGVIVIADDVRRGEALPKATLNAKVPYSSGIKLSANALDGNASLAPTAAWRVFKFIRRDHRQFQIRDDASNQYHPQDTRHTRLATQLLRAHHPR